MSDKIKHVYSNKQDEFLAAIVYVFSLAKWFGIPCYGGKCALYGAVILFGMLLALDIGAIWKLVRLLGGMARNTADGRGFVPRLSGSIFYTNAILSLFLSWRFIASWKHVAEYWTKVETSGGIYFPPNPRIKKTVIYLTWVVAVVAIVEHTMSMIAAIGLDTPLEMIFKKYILNSHGFLLQPDEYNLWIAIPVFILSKLATILWNFQDLIIILISLGLTSRYKRLNLYVTTFVTIEKRDKDIKKYGTELYIQVQTWRRLREAYVRQAALVRIINQRIGSLVLLSNLSNFYFICLQLFLGINGSQGSLISLSYYMYSLGWLLLRASSVMLMAADVNVHSRKALPALFDCPGSTYNIEIKRLKYQLSNDTVVITGLGLFSLYRQTLLEVAASILKYELVMIQYDNKG